MFRSRCVLIFAILLGTWITTAAPSRAYSQNAARTPSDVVREFYKGMREHRFNEAFALTIYKSAVEGLSAEEMEDLRPGFEEKAALIPPAVEIIGEQINGNTAIVFVRIPATINTPQVTSEPVYLFNSGGWIIGTETDMAVVKKAGHRYFLDALVIEHEGDVEDLLKRLVVLEGIYSQQHAGIYGEISALISAGMLSTDAVDPKLSGYNFHITLTKDGKGYVANAEPARHGRTGKLSFRMDQTGLIKSSDTGGKPLKP
jgi:hypothetical protein